MSRQRKEQGRLQDEGYPVYDPRGGKALKFIQESVHQEVLGAKSIDSKKADI